ncbi:MAG: OmpH family outer membrane protein [Veillonella sp.]|uniref:OmpH family outer membrane protein n=1 Tax=Veillonella sp. TaxID=1926307 RepID=UPI0029141C47|nr:OmpH family outer membrane protein [Veillonella sp.]MDU5098623.1 OmpH family outer membrane protein [Veillonella sp.]
MMRMMNNKANVKIFSIVIAAIFIVGIGALAYTQMASPSSNSGTSTIGVIDTSRMLSQDNPIYISVAQEYMSYQSQLQQETQAKIDAAQDDATKQKIAEEARQNLAKKDQEIAKSVQDKAMEAAKAVGDAKGLSVVMTKDTVLYGGVDITDQVLKKLATDAKK